MTDDQPREQILFVTGKLAESSLRKVLHPLAEDLGFEWDVVVLKISVAALMNVEWLERQLNIEGQFSRVILPGWVQGDVARLAERFGVSVERGPKNLFDLPEFLGHSGRRDVDLSRYDIEILAEINHAPQLSDREILEIAERYRNDGADVIDLGCIPGESWSRIGEVTKQLCDSGFRVSVDSFDRFEVEAAVKNGAELVLSCQSSNRDWLSDLGAEVVAIPDEPSDMNTLAETVAFLTERNCPFRIDPILEPIGFGFAASLERYFHARRQWPNAEIMMGIGNVTELSEADSNGMNLLLAGICQELKIRSVLTTEVINWARTAVKEFDLARRMVHYSINEHVLPKHLGQGLTLLREPRVNRPSAEDIEQLALGITDPNFRILIDDRELHVLNRDGHWRGRDPYELFDRVLAETKTPDATHAFYLGYELSKAKTALDLGKQYIQDEALNWGFLTQTEISAHDRRKRGGSS